MQDRGRDAFNLFESALLFLKGKSSSAKPQRQVVTKSAFRLESILADNVTRPSLRSTSPQIFAINTRYLTNNQADDRSLAGLVRS